MGSVYSCIHEYSRKIWYLLTVIQKNMHSLICYYVLKYNHSCVVFKNESLLFQSWLWALKKHPVLQSLNIYKQKLAVRRHHFISVIAKGGHSSDVPRAISCVTVYAIIILVQVWLRQEDYTPQTGPDQGSNP